MKAADAEISPVVYRHSIEIGQLIQTAIEIQDAGYDSDQEVRCVESNLEDGMGGEAESSTMGRDLERLTESTEDESKAMGSRHLADFSDGGSLELQELTGFEGQKRGRGLIFGSSDGRGTIPPKKSPAKNLTRKEKQRQRRNAANHRKRRVKRIAAAKGKILFQYRFKRPPKSMPNTLPPIKVDINAVDLPVAGGGSFIGRQLTFKRKEPWTVDELLAQGFRKVDWDGESPLVIVDRNDVVIAALAGRPMGETNWGRVASDAWGTLQKIRELAVKEGIVPDDELDHRRGRFLSLPNGVSFGGGQVRPGNLCHPTKVQKLIQIALANKSIGRIAGFQTSALAFYNETNFREMQEATNKLFGRYPDLIRNFSNSVYPAVTFNCGPQTECLEHTDHGNAPNSFCAITALGDFDLTKGGHLILFPLKLFIPLRPGDTAMITSATVSHGNTPIQPGEKRGSMTQYCAGGLLRWVSYGFQSAKSLSTTELGRAFIKKIDGPPGERWKRLVNSFTTLSMLEANLKNVQDSR